MTGYGQEEDRRRSQEAGFNAHLVKPVNFEELQALLEPLRAGGVSLIELMFLHHVQSIGHDRGTTAGRTRPWFPNLRQGPQRRASLSA